MSSVVVRYSLASLTAEQYDEAIRLIRDAGPWPPEGLEYHVCFGSNGDLQITEVWTSRERLEAFRQWLRPVVSRIGRDLGEPEVLEIYSAIGR
jgi:hypothetical protein